jgi:hypothetical protein
VIEVSPAVWWEMRGAPSWRLLEELPVPIPPVFLSQVRSFTLYMYADDYCVSVCDDVDARSLFVDI